ncbi:PASTA domain-containing protein [Sandaracinobacteroides hominis]|uniref:PASTA domain-containing protein n=1 Tax=Sandaracinobacteroides hominis TaxID=2780086 RepID=UPI0018F3D164|nr:PASTA domain-containing protein [Sandaracinobacteroides hominis]
MRAGFSLAVLSLLWVSAAAAQVPEKRRCIARSGEVVFELTGKEPTLDAMQYKGAEGLPRRGGAVLPLCNGTRYRIVPAGGRGCLVTVPAQGSAEDIERRLRKLAKSLGCPMPKLTLVSLEDGTGSTTQPVLRTMPSRQIDLSYHREIALLVGRDVPPTVDSPPPPPVVDDVSGVEAPDLIGRPMADARDIVRGQGLPTVLVATAGRLREDMGEADLAELVILAQNPAPGTAMAAGERLVVTAEGVEVLAEPTSLESQPGTLLASGLLAGVTGTQLVRGVRRRRKTGEDGGKAAPTPTGGAVPAGGWRVRARPDLPPRMGVT